MDEELKILRELIKDAESIKGQRSEDLKFDWEKVRRWESRCADLIEKNVSPEEKSKFNKESTATKPRVNPYANFIQHIERKINFLKALVDDIEKNPEYWKKNFRVNKKMKNKIIKIKNLITCFFKKYIESKLSNILGRVDFSKLRKKHWILIIIIFLAVLSFLALNFYKDLVELWSFYTKEEQIEQTKESQTILGPSLKFSDVKFLYYDLNGESLNEYHENPEVNLEKVKRVEVFLEIENDGNIDLLVFHKKNFIKTSSGQFLADQPPNIITKNYPIAKGEEPKYINAVEFEGKGFLEELRNNKSFYLYFEPEIEYFLENKVNEKYPLNTIMRCGDQYSSTRLPLFKKNCIPDKIINQY